MTASLGIACGLAVGWFFARATRRNGVQVHAVWLARDKQFLDDLEAAIQRAWNRARA